MTEPRRLPLTGLWSSQLAALPRQRQVHFLERVEGLGYGMVWIPEAFGREALANAALVLSSTGRMMAGTGIANIWARDAVAMANGARTLGEAFPGRFVLGVGVSHAPMVESRAHEYAAPVTALERYLERMDAARWTGPPLPTPVPRVVGALGPRALGVAARLADGVHPYLVTPSYTRVVREAVGADALVAPEQAAVVTEDAADGRRAGRAHLARYLDRPNYRNSFLRQGFTMDDLEGGGSDRLVDALVVWGPPAVVRARVDEHVAAGADHVAVQVLAADHGGDPLPAIEALAPVITGSAATSA